MENKKDAGRRDDVAPLEQELSPTPADAGGIMTVTVSRACSLTGLGRTTIYKAIRAGQLRKLKYGSRTLIPVSDLRQLIGWNGSLQQVPVASATESV